MRNYVYSAYIGAITRAFSGAVMVIRTPFISTLMGVTTLLASVTTQAIEFNQIQPDKSAVSFVFKQMNVPVEGSFKRFTGHISFDPARPTQARANLDIPLASIDAGSDEANDEVAGVLWFNTKAYPLARFVSTAVRPLGNNRFEVSGQMSIKGRTHPASTQATFRQLGNSGVFAGSFVLKRADYGIGEGMWADFGTVANEVQINFQLVAVASK
jgi:polyisoprenoid-binding protein YceI